VKASTEYKGFGEERKTERVLKRGMAEGERKHTELKYMHNKTS
jgi:hypothetical protein